MGTLYFVTSPGPGPNPQIVVHVMTDQIGSVAEIIGAIVAGLALGFSLIAFVISARSSKRSVFHDLQTDLNSADSAEGRRLIHQLGSVDDARRIHRRRPRRWDKMNLAVNHLNTLAQYRRHRLVDGPLAVKIWGRAVRELWPGLEMMITYRRSLGRADKWSSLVEFAAATGADVPIDLRTTAYTESRTLRRMRVEARARAASRRR